MAVPANRVPVRVARGLKSALTANLADLLEGEVVYAKDEDKLYAVEGGALVALGADLGTSSVGDLSDVTITAAATGEVLRYDGSAWVDAQLDYADLSGTPTLVTDLNGLSDVTVTAAATGEVLRYNGSAWVDAQLNSSDLNNDAGFIANITAEPIGDLSDVVLTSPTNGEVLQYNGTNWVNATGGGGGATQLDELTDVSVSGAVAGQNLQYNGSNWVNTTFNRSIDELSDVDTTTSGPSSNQTLLWNGVDWIPGDPGLAGGTVSFGSVSQVSETQTAASGAATFSGIGQSGVLVNASSDIEAWVVLYPTAAARTADASRGFGTDPSPGSGVLAEFLVPAAGTVLASPGTYYYNNDTTASDAIYAAVRTQGGANADAQVTLKAYKQTNAASGVGGTTRTTEIQTAAGGTADFTAIGVSGTFVSITSDIDAWVTFYTTAATRTADSGRAFSTDPVTGDGVLLDIYITAGQTIDLTPAIGYFNDDTTPTETIYTAVRDNLGVAANATITIRAYAQGLVTGFSGGTFGSG